MLKQTVSKGGVRLHIHPPKSSQINLIWKLHFPHTTCRPTAWKQHVSNVQRLMLNFQVDVCVMSKRGSYNLHHLQKLISSKLSLVTKHWCNHAHIAKPANKQTSKPNQSCNPQSRRLSAAFVLSSDTVKPAELGLMVRLMDEVRLDGQLSNYKGLCVWPLLLLCWNISTDGQFSLLMQWRC